MILSTLEKFKFMFEFNFTKKTLKRISGKNGGFECEALNVFKIKAVVLMRRFRVILRFGQGSFYIVVRKSG